jgi:hypothetical protein
MVDQRKCTSTRRDGSPCQARALPNEPWCWAHSPTLAGKRRQAHSTGGQGKSSTILTTPFLLDICSLCWRVVAVVQQWSRAEDARTGWQTNAMC